MRDGVENPFARAGANVKGADVTRRRRTWTFADGGTHDDRVFINDAGRTRANGEEENVAIEAVVQIDAAFVAK
jgi:hypothetical protein